MKEAKAKAKASAKKPAGGEAAGAPAAKRSRCVAEAKFQANVDGDLPDDDLPDDDLPDDDLPSTVRTQAENFAAQDWVSEQGGLGERAYMLAELKRAEGTVRKAEAALDAALLN